MLLFSAVSTRPLVKLKHAVSPQNPYRKNIKAYGMQEKVRDEDVEDVVQKTKISMRDMNEDPENFESFIINDLTPDRYNKSGKNILGLTPEYNILFPDSNKTDIEIIGDSFDKIGKSFEEVQKNVENEAKLVEQVFISDLQKTLGERKQGLSTKDPQDDEDLK
jgi:hypothetical protein